MKKVAELMSTRIHTTEPEATVQSAAQLMRKHDIGMLPVVTREGRAVGTITDRDIAIRGVADGMAPAHGKVLEAMTPGVEFCYEDDNIEELAKSMGDKKVHRLIVIDRGTKALKGIVSLTDLATGADDKRMAGDVLAQCVGS